MSAGKVKPACELNCTLVLYNNTGTPASLFETEKAGLSLLGARQLYRTVAKKVTSRCSQHPRAFSVPRVDRGYPLEGCGLVGEPLGGQVQHCSA